MHGIWNETNLTRDQRHALNLKISCSIQRKLFSHRRANSQLMKHLGIRIERYTHFNCSNDIIRFNSCDHSESINTKLGASSQFVRTLSCCSIELFASFVIYNCGCLIMNHWPPFVQCPVPIDCTFPLCISDLPATFFGHTF